MHSAEEGIIILHYLRQFMSGSDAITFKRKKKIAVMTYSVIFKISSVAIHRVAVALAYFFIFYESTVVLQRRYGMRF